MIPLLDSRGRQIRENGRPRWQKTKADSELAACDSLTIDYASGKYPVWKFMEMFFRIKGKSGRRLPLELNDAQVFLYKEIESEFRKTGMVRLNVGKARQMGSSTFIEALYFAIMLTHPGFCVGILADTEDKGEELLNKYRFFFYNLPEAVQAEFRIASDNAGKFAIDFGKGMVSSVEVVVANENAGASKTFQALHCSEVALWPAIEDTVPVLEATVYDGPGTFIIRETTARGMNGWKRLYEAGKSRMGLFRSVFLAWWRDSGYKAKYDGHELSKEERRLRSLGCSPDQIQWWHQRLGSYGGDLKKMKQEFPSTESEMWQTTSVCVFNMEKVAARKEEVEGKWLHKGDFEFDDPTTDGTVDGEITLEGAKWHEDQIGAVTIFEEPIPGHPYAIVCDPAEMGDDFYAAHVVDCSNGHQAATYHKQKVYFDKASFQCYCLWLYYANLGADEDGLIKEDKVNRVFVSGERNSTRMWLRTMQRLGAGPVRVDRADDEAGAYRNELGYRTTPGNRQGMYESFAADFEADPRIINDYETLCEMETFQKYSRVAGQAVKAQALKGCHDDLVMAYAGYCHCRADFECNVESVGRQSAAPKGFGPLDRPARSQSGNEFMDW